MNYAGFWRRFAARFIDGLILIIPSLLIGIVAPILGSILIFFLYNCLFESSEANGTPGKRIMGLKVMTEAGLRITYKQAFIRNISSILSGLFLCIGYLFNLFTPKRQTFHDIMAGIS